MALVPHVNRQEVYMTGEGNNAFEGLQTLKDSPNYDPGHPLDQQLNVSPVNFFVPNLKKYPHFSQASTYQVRLEPGDCVFVPAFYFFQY